MPKYDDFDLDLQNTNSSEFSISMIKTGPYCIIYTGRYTCNGVTKCVHTDWDC